MLSSQIIASLGLQEQDNGWLVRDFVTEGLEADYGGQSVTIRNVPMSRILARLTEKDSSIPGAYSFVEVLRNREEDTNATPVANFYARDHGITGTYLGNNENNHYVARERSNFEGVYADPDDGTVVILELDSDGVTWFFDHNLDSFSGTINYFNTTFNYQTVVINVAGIPGTGTGTGTGTGGGADVYVCLDHDATWTFGCFGTVVFDVNVVFSRTTPVSVVTNVCPIFSEQEVDTPGGPVTLNYVSGITVERRIINLPDTLIPSNATACEVDPEDCCPCCPDTVVPLTLWLLVTSVDTCGCLENACIELTYSEVDDAWISEVIEGCATEGLYFHLSCVLGSFVLALYVDGVSVLTGSTVSTFCDPFLLTYDFDDRIEEVVCSGLFTVEISEDSCLPRIQTDCCENPISQTLFATQTWPTLPFCTCMLGATFTLVWSEVDQEWASDGTFDCDGNFIRLHLWCDTGDWHLSVESIGDVTTEVSFSSVTCDPLSITFDSSNSGWAAGCAGRFVFVVTE